MDSASQQPAGTAHALRGVAHFVSADARLTLERIQTSELLAEGKVCLLGLDAVRDRLGPRWPGRREMVYQHIQGALRRHLGAHGFFVRISETDFLVAQPGVGRLEGQAYCLNCLREVLTYFLGEALIADLVVCEVTTIGGNSPQWLVNRAATDITAGALAAQKTRLDIVAQNIANAQTTRTPAGGPAR